MEDLKIAIERLTRLLAITNTQNLTNKEKISVLYRAGFKPKEIADLLETNQNVVNVRLSEMRKMKGGKMDVGEK